MNKIFAVVCVMLVFSFAASEEKEEKALLLKIGDPQLKEEILEISSDHLYSARKGEAVSFEDMIKDLEKNRFIYIGESHDSLPIHKIQAKIIQALYDKKRDLSIGLEMLPASLQPVLDKWINGKLTAEEFIREAEWYVNWNFHFGFYEEIFLFARDNKIPLYALNAPRKSITKIRMKGWEALSDEEKKLIPEPDVSHEEHRLLIRTIFENTDLPHQMKGEGLELVFKGLYRAQSAWDGVMAHNAIRASEQDNRILVVLAGTGHLLYNLGINRKVNEANDEPFRTIVCLDVDKEKSSIRVARSLADFIWGLPEEDYPAYPSVGLSFKKFDGLDNLVIDREPMGGAAKKADFKKGDVVLAVDGRRFDSINEVRRHLSRFTWNDEVEFHLLRSGKEVRVMMKFGFPEKDEGEKGTSEK